MGEKVVDEGGDEGRNSIEGGGGEGDDLGLEVGLGVLELMRVLLR